MTTAATSSLSPMTKQALVELMVHGEVLSSKRAFPEPRADWHHAFALMAEEHDEVWDMVKAVKYDRITAEELIRLAKELKQVAAMAIRFAIDCVPDGCLVIAAKDDIPFAHGDLRDDLARSGYVFPGSAARLRRLEGEGSK